MIDRHEVLEEYPKTNSRIGMPFSLAFPDKGLSTVITNSNTDAYGTSLSQHQISNVNKIRYLDKISNSRKTKIRTLRMPSFSYLYQR
jgi:transcription initiation factor TFIIB